MNLSTNKLSPDVFRVAVLGLGVIAVFAAWRMVDARIAEIGYEQVYGEQAARAAVPERQELAVLPIVVATQAPSPQDATAPDDALIESAFKVPEPEPEVSESAVPEVKFTLAQQLVAAYRPAVSAIANGGAIINGIFWKPGEEIGTMPVMTRDGRKLFPLITAITSSGITLQLAEETISLPFDHY